MSSGQSVVQPSQSGQGTEPPHTSRHAPSLRAAAWVVAGTALLIAAASFAVSWIGPVNSFFDHDREARKSAWEALTALTVIAAASYAFFEFGYKRREFQQAQLKHEQERLKFDIDRFEFSQRQEDRAIYRADLSISAECSRFDERQLITIRVGVKNLGLRTLRLTAAEALRPRLLVTLYDDVAVNVLAATSGQEFPQLLPAMGYMAELWPYTTADGQLRHAEIEPGATISSMVSMVVPAVLGKIAQVSAQFLFIEAESKEAWTTDMTIGVEG